VVDFQLDRQLLVSTADRRDALYQDTGCRWHRLDGHVRPSVPAVALRWHGDNDWSFSLGWATRTALFDKPSADYFLL